MMFRVEDYFDLDQEPLADLFEGCEMVWDALKTLKERLQLRTASPRIEGEVHPTAVIKGLVSIGEGSIIGPHVHIVGPVFIGKNAEIRHGAYIRENSIIGDRCVVGHDSELKGTIMLTGSHAPHFAYLGDSILGRHVNLGAGTKLGNFKLQGDQIVLRHEGQDYPTGLRKFGAIIGDDCSIGCNAVTAPGTLIGKRVYVYSLVSLRGVIGPDCIVKLRQEQEIVARR